jgi:hypothetical protein
LNFFSLRGSAALSYVHFVLIAPLTVLSSFRTCVGHDPNLTIFICVFEALY